MDVPTFICLAVLMGLTALIFKWTIIDFMSQDVVEDMVEEGEIDKWWRGYPMTEEVHEEEME